VWVEGALAIDNLDIVQAAGGASSAYVVPVQTTVSDGFVTVELVAVVENPCISAIEILTLSAPTPVASPIAPPVASPVATPPTSAAATRINVGGDQLIDTAGNTWIADNYFGGKGVVYDVCPKAVANTADDNLYCKNRWFAPWDGAPFVYQIPVPNGDYNVRLHFAELVSLLLALALSITVVALQLVTHKAFRLLSHSPLVFHNNWTKSA
jgi:Malectin domain